MGPREWAEHRDEYRQAKDGSESIFEQLQANVCRELLGRDARADDDDSQQGAAEKFPGHFSRYGYFHVAHFFFSVDGRRDMVKKSRFHHVAK